MKSTTKRTLFSMTIMLLIGMSNQLVHAQTLTAYFTEMKAGAIYSTTLEEGAVKENIHISAYNKPFHIAVDQASGKMYWTDLGDPNLMGDETIRVANLDGTNMVILLKAGLDPDVQQPAIIKLDPQGEKMYWTDTGWLANGIHRANLDGTNHEWIMHTYEHRVNYGTGPGQNLEFAQVWGLALDLRNGVMYWSDYFNRDIHVADLYGTPEAIAASVLQILSGLPGARGIAVDSGDPATLRPGKLYWTTSNAGDIMWSNLDGTGSQTLTKTALNGDTIVDLKRPMDIAYLGGRICFTDNNGGYVVCANADGSAATVVQELQYERTEKPGRFKALDPLGIAMLIEPSTSPAPVPSPTPAPAPDPVPAPEPVVLSVPRTPSVEYRADKGEWRISVSASAIGSPTTYRVEIYDPINSANTLVLVEGQSTSSITAVKIKGMTLASQGLPENRIYRAVSVSVGGVRSASSAVAMR